MDVHIFCCQAKFFLVLYQYDSTHQNRPSILLWSMRFLEQKLM